MAEDYDIVIIGAGPAGLAAGLYAARARRRSLVIEKNVTGGQIALTSAVENYPGILEINGFDLGQAMLKQAETHGLETAYTSVNAIDSDDGAYMVRTDEGDYRAKAIILTGGADYNRLGIEGEERLTGFGVSYCGTCDAAFFKDVPVIVVGGGDAAMDEAMFISRYASKVIVVHRREELRASKILQERAFANPKIEFIWNTVVTRIEGERDVKSAHLKNIVTGEESDLPVAAVFVFIGQTPNTNFMHGLIDLDEGGHILTNLWMETNRPGIYAAGDIRAQSARQVVTGAGDGATAAIAADHYISGHFGGD